jgi:hypothetical protein
MRFKMTPAQRETRRERRAVARTIATEKRDAFRQWRQARADLATKRAQQRRKELLAEPRGLDRVPARLRGLSVTVERLLVGKRGTLLAQPEDLHPSGNHAERRARGQRGHQRKPRRRELPGAVERRLERRRKAWLDGMGKEHTR